jgi:hypothetical protein
MIFLIGDHLPSTGNAVTDIVLRSLAVAGGAAIGGFGLGWLAQITARLTVVKPLPRWAIQVLRLAGGLTAGCIIWLWVFGSGGPNFGFGSGGGGWPFGGSQPGPNGGETKPARETTAVEPDDSIMGAGALRIEVLGDRPEERTRFYRVEGTKDRLTLDQVREAVRERKKQSPPPKAVVIVLYRDSPDEPKAQVQDLLEMAKDFKLRYPIDRIDRPAPQ